MPVEPPPTADQASSAITTRMLPAEEWAEKLADTELAPHLDRLRPDSCGVAVVEVDGRVVACWAAMTIVHVEGLWVDPAYRKHPGVGRALVTTMAEDLKRAGVPEVLTVAIEPAVEILAEKVGGTKVPGSLWAIPLAGLEDR